MDALETADLTVEHAAPSPSEANPSAETSRAAPLPPPEPEVVAPTAPQPTEPVAPPAPTAEAAASRQRNLLRRLMLAGAKRLATLGIALVALLMGLTTWDYYVTAPWTRDGRVRVQVASVAPQVSGQITELRVGDNQYVHRGDVLYVIDPFDFQVALRADNAQLQQRAADLQVKQLQSDRRQHLSELATN